MNSKQCVLYVRVSTSEQTSENQLLALREYAQRMGFPIVAEYIDDGFSGKDDKRPAFEKLMKDMREKKFDCILVWKIDRIGRSLQHLLSFLQELRNKKMDFISMTESLDTTTPHGELIWNVLASVSQYERSLIVARTKAGLERARAEGKQIGRRKGQKDKKPRKKDGYFRRWKK